jgi:hypothetical protein
MIQENIIKLELAIVALVLLILLTELVAPLQHIVLITVANLQIQLLM